MNVRNKPFQTILAIALIACCASLVSAEDNEPPDTDRQLLEDLENDLLEGVELDKLPAKSKKGDEPALPPKDKAARATDTPSENSADENPLTEIGRRMFDVSERLARDDSSEATQAEQKQIVTDLKDLIRNARKRQSSAKAKGLSGRTTAPKPISKAAGSKKSATARAGATVESTERLGKADAKKVDAAEVRERVEASWGVLPEQVREQMRHSAEDDFLGEFELMIENYFKTLAETEPDRP